MPRPRRIDLLPEDVRRELERKLIAQGFGGYHDLAAWLQSQGFEIQKSAVHEWGQDFKDRLQAIKLVTEQARAIQDASPDDENALSDAMLRLMQEKAMTFLLDWEIDPQQVNLPRMMQAIAQMTRAANAAKKHAMETREKIDAKFSAMETEAKDGKRAGFDLETLKRVREEIYGIVA